MSKKKRRPNALLLAVISSTVLIAAAFIYYQIINTHWNAELETPQQTQLVNNSLNNAKSTNSNFVNEKVINPKDYEQFWLWTPPKDEKKISQAHTLYILQGEIRPENMPYYRPNNNKNTVHPALATLTPQGLGVRSLSGKKIWLVYRATSQEWSEEVMTQLIERLEKWQRAGNQVMGIQIDYDAPTYQLDKYAQLLNSIRQQLPAQYQLSVTGLLDWSNQADDSQFIQLSDAIDELVIQTYQGTITLPNYSQYLKKLENLPFDFKVGIIEGGQWQGADFLEDNPHFKGYVVFLR